MGVGERVSAHAALARWLVEDSEGCKVVLDTLFPGKKLFALADRLGLTYPGHRITQVPREEVLAALSEAVQTRPEVGREVMQEVLGAVRREREVVGRLSAEEAIDWIEESVDEREGIRRLVAAVADGRPEVSVAARSWWEESPPIEEEFDLLQDVVKEFTGSLEEFTRQMTEAARSLERTGKQLREVARSVEQGVRERERRLEKEVARIEGQVDQVVQELSRTRTWFGEQQAQVRKALETLTSTLNVLGGKVERQQSRIDELVGQVGAIAAALGKRQLEVARRELARLRAGPRKVGVFVDVSNLSVSAGEAYGKTVRYKVLLERARQLGEVVVAWAYAVEVPGRWGELEEDLRRAGFEVKLLATRRLPDGRVKANWDLGMATDIMRVAPDLDVVLLGSGDGDFTELVRWLREQGLVVHVSGVRGHIAQELVSAADGWIPIEEDLLAPGG